MAYLLESMIDKLGFRDGNPNWTSDDHRRVAMTALVGNRYVREREPLIACVKIINEIPADRIRLITFAELDKLGVPVLFSES